MISLLSLFIVENPRIPCYTRHREKPHAGSPFENFFPEKAKPPKNQQSFLNFTEFLSIFWKTCFNMKYKRLSFGKKVFSAKFIDN